MVQFPNRLEARIDEKEQEFDLIDQVYPAALARVEGRDPAWELQKKAIIERIAKTVLLYKFEDPAHKAVALIAQVQAECKELLAPQRIVEDWKERKAELLFLRQEEEKQRTASRRAGEAYEAERQKWTSRATG